MVIGIVDEGFPIGKQEHDGPFSEIGITDLKREWKRSADEEFPLSKKIVDFKNYPVGKKRSQTHRCDISNDHGFLCAFIASGNYKAGEYFDITKGTMRGSAPKAKVALYECASNPNGDGLLSSTVYRAILGAVDDNVDVLSISLGRTPTFPPTSTHEYRLGSSERGSLFAALAGIVNCFLAGNDGGIAEVSNSEPWQLTVGGCTSNKSFYTKICLGDGQVIRGHSTNLFDRTGLCPLISLDDAFKLSENATSSNDEPALDPEKVKGKILFTTKCQGKNVKAIIQAKAKGMIILTKSDNNKKIYPMPAANITQKELDMIENYCKSNSNCVAEIFPTVEDDEKVGDYPVLWSRSSKGPNPKALDINKPDICAPAEMIVPALEVVKAVDGSGAKRSSLCRIARGTSLSTPLVAGAIAFLKSVHPTWSAAALKSSVMTTADPMIIKHDSDILGVGSGVINVDKARNPGLVYDMDVIDYLHYLTGRKYDFDNLPSVRFTKWAEILKREAKELHPRDLNLPNLQAAFLEDEKNWTFKRRLTNVGCSNSTYSCHVEKVDGLEILPRPIELKFDNLGDVRSFELDVRVADWSLGGQYGFRTFVEWQCENYKVRSYVVILRLSAFDYLRKKS